MSQEALRTSGSCPLVTKRKASKTVIRGFYSSTNLLSNKKMKRLISRGTPKIKASSDQPRNTRRRLHPENSSANIRDIFDFIPKRCVQVRPIRGVISKESKSDDPHGNSTFSSKLHHHQTSDPLATCNSKHRGRISASVSSMASEDRGCSPLGSRHIDVLVRIRPKNRQENGTKTVVWKTTSTDLLFDPKEKSGDFYYKGKKQCVTNDFGKRRRNKNLSFAFDYVYGPESTNQEMFNTSLKKLIDQVLDGYNCTVFAYGSTGSGKTYTMLGSSGNPGICGLMAEELYRRLEYMKDNYLTDVCVSYLEVYNETIKDLLKPDKELSIREDGKKGIIIPDLTCHNPRGPEDLLRLLKSGNNARSQHATDLNSESSRSHAVFQIAVVLRQRSEVKSFKANTSTSRLFMVDLAGSEKGISSTFDGVRQREGANINKSLLALSNCINALADGKAHIPYRNSKLTRLLKDSLSGNCVTIMIANVSPSELNFEDTHNTLHYANRAKNIKITCKQNYFSEELLDQENTQIQISELHDQIRSLTRQLEAERAKHHAIKEHQMGKGDALMENEVNAAGESYSSINPSSTVSSSQIVAYFQELMAKKAELAEEFADACVEARLHEWEMNWKKLKVDVADFLGKVDVSDPHFITLAKLKNAQSNLAAQYPELLSIACERKATLSTCNEEINEQLNSGSNKSPTLDGPFINLTLRDFLIQKEMEIDGIALKKLCNFHQNMSEKLLGELIDKEVHSVHLMTCLQNLRSLLSSSSTESELLSHKLNESFQSLLSPVYGSPFNFQPPTQTTRAKYSIKEDLSNLEKTVTRPVVELPCNESILGGQQSEGLRISGSTFTVGVGSPIMSTHSWISKDDAADTSNKDTTYSSSEEEMTRTTRTSDPSKIKGTCDKHHEHHHHHLDEDVEERGGRFVNSLESNGGSSIAVVASVTSSASSIEDSQTAATQSPITSSEEQAQEPLNVKKRKPLGNVTSRVSPGSSYLTQKQLRIDMRVKNTHSSSSRHIRERPSQLVLRSGRAFTNLTKVVVSTSSSRSSFDLKKKGIAVQVQSKPPIIPSYPLNCSARHQDNFIVNSTPSTFSFSEIPSCTSNR